MGIVRENIDFERGLDPKRSMKIGKASLPPFEDSREAGQYVKDNLFEITGFKKIAIVVIKDDTQMDPSLTAKLQKWYDENKFRIEDESEDDYWDEFVDWDAVRYGGTPWA